MDTVELKNTKSEIKKKSLDGLKSILYARAGQIGEVEKRLIEII